jgi:hypothetical protein
MKEEKTISCEMIVGTDAWFLYAVWDKQISVTLLQLETSKALKSALPSFSWRQARH